MIHLAAAIEGRIVFKLGVRKWSSMPRVPADWYCNFLARVGGPRPYSFRHVRVW